MSDLVFVGGMIAGAYLGGVLGFIVGWLLAGGDTEDE